jgi:hypothetical protein
MHDHHAVIVLRGSSLLPSGRLLPDLDLEVEDAAAVVIADHLELMMLLRRCGCLLLHVTRVGFAALKKRGSVRSGECSSWSFLVLRKFLVGSTVLQGVELRQPCFRSQGALGLRLSQTCSPLLFDWVLLRGLQFFS